MTPLRTAILLILVFAGTAGAQLPQLPVGATPFFNTGAFAVTAAAGGGVWVATPLGITRYTVAGQGVSFAIAGGTIFRIRTAANGSIWFAQTGLIGRISTTGTILEQYPLVDVRDIAVATDGALWYSRGSLGAVVGRISGGVATEFVSPTQSNSLAPAANGAVWILGTGFGTPTDDLYRMSPTGAVTVFPQTFNQIFGNLQVVPDGTLYISTGLASGGGVLYRLRPGAQLAERVTQIERGVARPTAEGDFWTGTYHLFGFVDATGTPAFEVPMPRDNRPCAHAPVLSYFPVALDAEGGVWVRVIPTHPLFIDPAPPPCVDPPPTLADLIRIDPAVFLDANTPRPIPALSPALLIALAAVLAAAALLVMRR